MLKTNVGGTLFRLDNLLEGPSCIDALEDLPDADKFRELWTSDEVRLSKKLWKKPSRFASEMRCLHAKDWHFAYPRNWESAVLTSSARTEHTAISRKRFERTQEGIVEPISRLFKLPSKGVSNTLRAGTDAARGAFTSPRPIHYSLSRLITVREMARLHGFPDWFRFHQTKWHGARQIGNAVPPPLARAIAFAINQAKGYRPQLVASKLELGNSELLRFDMKSASQYFDIVTPIKRRDRKSGAKKRSQAEIEAQLVA